MKILFVSASHSIHTVKWVNALAKRGHEILLVSKVPDTQCLNKIDPAVKIHYFKERKRLQSILAAPELRRVYKEFKPDIVHTHFASNYGITSALAGIRPNVLTSWGSDIYKNAYESKLLFRLVGYALRKADVVTLICHVMEPQARLVAGKDIDLRSIPFGVDVRKFVPPVEKKKNDEIVIGIVKTLRQVYRIDILIRAFAIVCSKCSVPARLDIYGEGELLGELQELAKSLGVAEKVNFKGAIPNDTVPQVLQEMDICAITSERETFGVALVEAMSCGLPVVATATDGFTEVVDDGNTGFIVPVNDYEKLAEKIIELINDESLRIEMGKKARERAVKLYDWEGNVTQMEELYREFAKKQ